ncbi:cellulose-binding domain-containing protein [Streptomyces glaucescens]|uniref:cellulose-binding domain-containing protein n=1 Tax=Streptomyces glaucescens TaxID=1907 RepID=UPI00344B0C10
MPDPPTPRDAVEAALFTECWDPVLRYADLCAAGPAEATRLAREAFARGIREARGSGSALPYGTGRRPARLPRLPLLLTAVRATAAAWEAAGQGHHLAPGLRRWLTSDDAARHTGPPPRRPLALRALRDLPEPDAALLWLTEVEALPPPVAARRLGLDPDGAVAALTEARRLFRNRCLRALLDAPPAPECGRCTRLLDAATRTPGTEIPEDLSRHLARCVDCAEAAACLRPHGGALPAALAGGVLGWGGPAYLERRRHAAGARHGPGRPDTPGHEPDDGATGQPRVPRNGLLAAAALVSLLALGVTLAPVVHTTGRATAPGETKTTGPGPAAAPGETRTTRPRPSPTTTSTPTPTPATRSARPAPAGPPPPAPPATATSGRPDTRPRPGPDPEPHVTATAPTAPDRTRTGHPACRVTYTLDNQWPDGFQATVTVRTDRPLDDWHVDWTFPDGQRVSRMWDASFTQDGPRVTARAAGHNRTVPAGGTLTFGFLASWQARNAPAYDITLNGLTCPTP